MIGCLEAKTLNDPRAVHQPVSSCQAYGCTSPWAITNSDMLWRGIRGPSRRCLTERTIKMATSGTQQQLSVWSAQHHAVMWRMGCYRFLTGDDFFSTIILYFHLSSMPHTYSFSDCHRAHTGKDGCMSGLTYAWAQTPFCTALQQTETFKAAEQKCCIMLQTRGNSTTDMHWTYKSGFQCEWFVVCFIKSPWNHVLMLPSFAVQEPNMH